MARAEAEAASFWGCEKAVMAAAKYERGERGRESSRRRDLTAAAVAMRWRCCGAEEDE